jgi:ATP-dependent protease ClpP protease subunit
MITIIGDIDEDQYVSFLTQLEEQSNNMIDVVLSSVGGNAMTAIAIHDTIKADPRKFRVTVYGSCQSAAVLILAAGSIRRMSLNSWVMVHEDTSLVDKHMKVTEAEKAAKASRMFETQWNRILEEDTGTRADVWENLHKEESYLTAEQCLELNLIQEIVKAG